MSTEDFLGSRDEANPVLLLGGDKSPFSFKDNLLYPLRSFTLGFGERITVPVTVTADPDTAPGGHYASVIIASEPSASTKPDTAGVAKIVSRVGVLFFVKVAGPTEEKGSITDFRVDPVKPVYFDNPDAFKILFENEGNVHLAPYGYIYINNMFGSRVDKLPVDAYFSMPNSLRYRTVVWGDDSFRLGRYKAILELHKNYKDKPDEVETRTIAFWILPWKPVTAAAIVIILLLIAKHFIFNRFEFRRKR
jgi:hypothetical protein